MVPFRRDRACDNIRRGMDNHGTSLDQALAAYRQAVMLQPGSAVAHHNLGNALRDGGRLVEAVAEFRQALALKPDLMESHISLGNALARLGQLEEAVAVYRRATALKPSSAQAYSNLGCLLRAQGQLDAAMAAFRQAVALKPDLAEAHYNLGNGLYDQGLLEQASAAYRQALALRPGIAGAWNNLGNCLRDLDDLDAAIAAYRRAVAIEPNYADAHSNLALALLLHGDFAAAWPEHEWRWRCQGLIFPGPLPAPRWDGGDLAGRTILLRAEQGFGDTLQFIRYVPLVAARCGRVVVECQAELVTLLRGMPGIGQLVAHGDALPAFDVYCPLLSLPLLFGTGLSNIPGTVPYLSADAARAEQWAARIASEAAAQGSPGAGRRPLRVGLAWAGRRTHINDHNRSIRPQALAPLGQVPQVSFYSLQKGSPAPGAPPPPSGLHLIDWTTELRDFADTAALVANLDLVITVDTSVAHLAGAMGKPVGVLLPFVPDWRWMRGRADSPWYPTMRLFRQPRRGDWEAVLRQVVVELQLRSSRGGGCGRSD
jgi:Flp pilus assembly protein TadD